MLTRGYTNVSCNPYNYLGQEIIDASRVKQQEFKKAVTRPKFSKLGLSMLFTTIP